MAVPSIEIIPPTGAPGILGPVAELDSPSPMETETENENETSSFPSHPIAALQGPFHESILEASHKSANEWAVEIDAQTRRRDLLENDEYERLCGRKWRQRDSEKYHPFWKLVSQMVFGVHLLAKRMAKSDQEVMRILQSHVDELDGFLQRSTEDFLIIQLDVRTRIQYLSLPLGNLDTFDEMLSDRSFRLSLVAYNDQIVHSIDRFTLAITDAIKDLLKGKEAMGALWHYLLQLSDEGCFESENLKAFYKAMMENMEGWIIAMSKLRRRGAALQKALGQLALAVTEMQRRVGVASRKDLRAFLKTTNSNFNRSKSIRQLLFAKESPPSYQTSNKPLPRDPLMKPKSTRKPATPSPMKTTANADEKAEQPRISKRASILPKSLHRAKSCSALVTAANADTQNQNDTGTETPPPPPIPGKLSRKLSRPFLPKRAASEKLDTQISQPTRPSTAPARTLKSRSASIEQLKTLWANSRPRTQQGISSKSAPNNNTTNNARRQQQQRNNNSNSNSLPGPGSSNPDTMKEQISQYLKTDRVIEAWDTITAKANCCSATLSKKDWPSSIFRANSSESLPHQGVASRTGTGNSNRKNRNKNGKLPGPDSGMLSTPDEIERQMSWIQEPECLNTYSFKRRPDISPRIHVLSVVGLDDGDGGDMVLSNTTSEVTASAASPALSAVTAPERGGLGESDETASIITALPAVPPPTGASISSLAMEARQVECH